MPWTIDGPSSEELGYLRHRERRDTGSAAPQDRPSRRPGWRWISIGIILALVALIGFYATAVWSQAHRNALVDHAVGGWVQPGGSSLTFSKSWPSPAVLFEGWVDGQEVRGAVVVAGFPSLDRTAHLTLLGQRWDLRLRSRQMMTLTNSSGRVIPLRRIEE